MNKKSFSVVLGFIEDAFDDERDDLEFYVELVKNSEKEFADPKSTWYKRKHYGDCTKTPITCITCCYEHAEELGKKYLPYLNRMCAE